MSFEVSSVESDFGVVGSGVVLLLLMGMGSVLFCVLVSSDVLDVLKYRNVFQSNVAKYICFFFLTTELLNEINTSLNISALGNKKTF